MNKTAPCSAEQGVFTSMGNSREYRLTVLLPPIIDQHDNCQCHDLMGRIVQLQTVTVTNRGPILRNAANGLAATVDVILQRNHRAMRNLPFEAIDNISGIAIIDELRPYLSNLLTTDKYRQGRSIAVIIDMIGSDLNSLSIRHTQIVVKKRAAWLDKVFILAVLILNGKIFLELENLFFDIKLHWDTSLYYYCSINSPRTQVSGGQFQNSSEFISSASRGLRIRHRRSNRWRHRRARGCHCPWGWGPPQRARWAPQAPRRAAPGPWR